MRLLRCSAIGEPFPTLEEFYGDIPPYAILSHRWSKPSDEVSFRDVETGAEISEKRGYRKLKWCCEQARKDGLEYAWIDTCCIDKSSSGELSEAINSMFSWYSNSAVCYVYLEDVHTASVVKTHSRRGSPFRRSKWWTRGWTLQELLAPSLVRFYDHKWGFIESKDKLAELISEITAIHPAVLRGDFDSLPHPISIAQKMSWAAGRETTRLEDRAYSLLGLFGVHMPPLYGEGSRAFIRLQEEIMKTKFDHSLFAWRNGTACCGLLAISADQFIGCGDVISVEYNKYAVHFRNYSPVPEFSQSNFGTRIQLPLLIDGSKSFRRAFLACTLTSKEFSASQKELVYVDLRKRSGAAIDTYERVDSNVCVVDSRSHRIKIRNIFVSNTSSDMFGFKNPARTHMKKIYFRADMTTFDNPEENGGPKYSSAYVPSLAPSTDSKWTYYYGAVLRLVDSRFDIDFLDEKDDAFVAIHIGNTFLGDAQILVGFFLLCGFHDGKLWTDVWFQRNSYSDGYQSVDFAYDLYQPGMTLGKEARSASRLSTEKNLQEVCISEGVIFGGPLMELPKANAKVGIQVTPRPTDEDGYTAYDAVINFLWT